MDNACAGSINDKTTLFCFPFAGASGNAYRSLFENLSPHINAYYCDYPGHGVKSALPLLQDLNEIVDVLLEELLQANLLGGKFLFYGHSMGAIVAYLMCRKLENTKGPAPLHLLVSGRAAPGINRVKNLHDLPSDAFWSSLTVLGGVPDEFISNIALTSYFEPIIRADITATEQWQDDNGEIITTPITALSSDGDTVTHEEVCIWRKYTSGDFLHESFKGDHFFIFKHAMRIRRIIEQLAGH